ncbi:facilitated trehalose transporter Tret1-2 homolog [Daktulosphaira vitifoliae]|uniref:facilitated trehalose transporter Tret1-2 homolog n=1 Tax=Daktulosphaira vitifoliae TaxID=58002 RepID=UPI0021AA5C15|nr:facilitated trehalose transporter Tret1-2 homolog [Daktulosphaira vitifoliae]
MVITNMCSAESIVGSKLFLPGIVKAQEKSKPLLKNDTVQSQKPKKGSSYRQILVALSANFGTINIGLVFGYPAVSLPQLQSPTSRIFINKIQASWIASVSLIGTPCGSILSGYLTDNLGRKKTLIATQLPAIIGWLMVGCATSVEWIYIGRFLVGLGSGMMGAPSRVYTAEVSQPHLRGVLAGFASVGTSLGVMLEYLGGSVLNWDTLAIVNALVPTISLCVDCFIPESPSWLISSKNDEQKCMASLKRVRDSVCDVESEVNNLIVSSKNNTEPTLKEKLKLMCKPVTIKPFVILCLYFIINQYSGVNIVTSYAVDIIKDSGSTIDKYGATVILGVIRLIFTIIGCSLMKKFGRKTLTYVSSVGCGISMLCLGSYMFQLDSWKSQGMESQATWLPIMTLYTFYAASTIGYLIVPWVMIGEVYPNQIRGIIGGLTTCVGHITIFIVLQTYPLFQEWFTKPGTFLFYGLVSITSTVFFYFFLPETKGRTLQEIGESFEKKKTPKIVKNVIIPDIVNNLPKNSSNNYVIV